jgi:CubicO group peptidase (beta-lactamase class C family)
LYATVTWQFKIITKYILEKLVSQDPGSVFHDNGGLSILLSRIIFDNTDLHADEFAEEYLFKPLGITTFVWDQLDDGLADTGGGLNLPALYSKTQSSLVS